VLQQSGVRFGGSALYLAWFCGSTPQFDQSRVLAMQAQWNGQVIATSDDIVTVDGNAYFPLEALDPACIQPSAHTSVCGWKGTAHYYDVVAGGQVNANAAWFYPEPKEAAKQIKGRVAFWKGVQVG
jgi:uncharacterized protein (DUF427 family)